MPHGLAGSPGPRCLAHCAVLWPCLVPGNAAAHDPGAAGGGVWALPAPWLGVILTASLLLYLRGWWHSRRHPAPWRPLLFVTGWAGLAATLAGPMDSLAHESLSAHMLQHMLLLTVIPPVLLLSRPLPQMIRGLPRGLRQRAGPGMAKLYLASSRHSLTAFLVHGAVIWFWHSPWAYQLALENRLLHDLEHACFLLTGLWFWWTLLAPARRALQGFGPACLWAVLTVMHTGMLGALLTFAPNLIYPRHPGGIAGLDALQDQQLAGLIMWVPGSMLYTFAALGLCLLWLERPDPPPSENRVSGQ